MLFYLFIYVCICLWNSSFQPGHTSPVMKDFTALEIEVKGSTEPYQVLLEPYAIVIPGEIFISTTICRQFKVIYASFVICWPSSTDIYRNHCATRLQLFIGFRMFLWFSDVEPQQNLHLFSMGANMQQQPHNRSNPPYWQNRCVTHIGILQKNKSNSPFCVTGLALGHLV